MSTIPVSCNGLANGMASVTVNGGTSPYSYSWSNGTTSATINNLAVGTYMVTVVDANACVISGSIAVSEPDVIAATANIGDVTCRDSYDGTALLLPTGGTPPYAFNWENGEVNNPAIFLEYGDHQVTITDFNGCTAVETVNIGGPDVVLPLGITTTSPTCFGASDGAATASATGGTPPYTFAWGTTPVQYGASISGLASGVYILSITDSNGCSYQAVNVTINEAPAMLDLQVYPSAASCYGANDGIIVAVPSGGNPSYTYVWNNGATEQTALNLDAGNYAVTVSDANGCTTFGAGVVTQPTQIIPSILGTNASCFGFTDGSIVIDTTATAGGEEPYTYSLDGSSYQTSPSFDNLEYDLYTVYVQDITGCTVEQQVYINEPPQLAVDLGVDIILELGDSIELEAVVLPSEEHITYSWEATDSLSCNDCAAQFVRPLEDMSIFVNVLDTLTGCEAEDDINLFIQKDRDVFIPNAFTPNGDGINDVFLVFGSKEVSHINKMRVYDRWGESVFEATDILTDDPSMGWDGTFKGKKMNPAVFVYYVQIEFIDGEVVDYKGDVALLK